MNLLRPNLSDRAFLFPLIIRAGGRWTWREVLEFNRGVLWFMVLGNLTFGGLFTALFVPGFWRIVSNPEALQSILVFPEGLLVVLLYLFVLMMALAGLTCLLGAVRLTIYLVLNRRGHI